MPDKTLEQARALIRDRRYAEARHLLEKSDSPDMTEWMSLMREIESANHQAISATLGLFFAMSTITTGIIFAGVMYFVFLGFLRRPHRK